MKADKNILLLSYSSVIETFAKMGNISLREALNIFYKSEVYIEMREGISDMHCRSENYLAAELLRESEKACQSV